MITSGPMLPMVLLFILFIVVFVALTRLAGALMGRMTGKVIAERHRCAEYIIDTGKVPTAWVQGLSPRGRAAPRLRKHLLDKLDSMTRLFAHSPVFEDDEARRLFLGEIRRVRATWSTADLQQIMEGGPGARSPESLDGEPEGS